ncbi:MAG TPA: N-6 DNA methylase [Candidatus Limnocylindrales bacterium]|nr:N-6 DNA methylase [Candidatus Limnocylindrales bacterium]
MPKKSLQEYFTTSSRIVNCMVSLLQLPPGSLILEPCAGTGHFIRALLKKAYRVFAVELSRDHYLSLHRRWGDCLSLLQGDFLEMALPSTSHPVIFQNVAFDGIIANPPYGMYLEPVRRRQFKKVLGPFYTRETYGLFLKLSAPLLREGGRLVYIIPDTFLSVRMHFPLRRYLFKEMKVTHLITFPSHFFPGVDFGYARLCILGATRVKPKPEDVIEWIQLHSSDGPESLVSLDSLPSRKHLPIFYKDLWLSEDLNINYVRSYLTAMPLRSYFSVLLKDKENPRESKSPSDFPFLKKKPEVSPFLPEGFVMNWSPGLELRRIDGLQRWVPLGELATCKTGIYTGDNSRFHYWNRDHPPRKKSGQPLDWRLVQDPRTLSTEEKTFGIEGDRHFVPLIKGGHYPPVGETRWAIDWSREALRFYQTDKKARFQNSSWYFKKGLAVPMVTSGRLSASLMEHSVFDQGVVGVFPYEAHLIPFLLLYLNTSLATQWMKEVINPSANNSANYVKKLPVPVPKDQQVEACRIKLAELTTQIVDTPEKVIRGWIDKFFQEMFQQI